MCNRCAGFLASTKADKAIIAGYLSRNPTQVIFKKASRFAQLFFLFPLTRPASFPSLSYSIPWTTISLTMMTDTEIRVTGIAALSATLGSVEAERFIALILREPFDYTRWQQTLFEDHSVADISSAATLRRDQRAEGADQPATAAESKLEGKEKTEPESEVRPQ